VSEDLVMAAALEQVVDVIRGHRFRYVDEDELQRGLTAALSASGLPVEREVRLDARSRIDLLVGRVGVEVKVGGATGALERQVERYAASDAVDAIVVVSSRVRHLRLPAELNGKPIEVVSAGSL
jgi:hypothetical protein